MEIEILLYICSMQFFVLLLVFIDKNVTHNTLWTLHTMLIGN